mmetsp:Transcript_23324/g.47611  ORF Transcript_23324/g.47611 Transcript_23324/m.47611 type:complete len:411 (-) Transcript_23324:284-1516(-)
MNHEKYFKKNDLIPRSSDGRRSEKSIRPGNGKTGQSDSGDAGSALHDFHLRNLRHILPPQRNADEERSPLLDRLQHPIERHFQLATHRSGRRGSRGHVFEQGRSRHGDRSGGSELLVVIQRNHERGKSGSPSPLLEVDGGDEVARAVGRHDGHGLGSRRGGRDRDGPKTGDLDVLIFGNDAENHGRSDLQGILAVAIGSRRGDLAGGRAAIALPDLNAHRASGVGGDALGIEGGGVHGHFEGPVRGIVVGDVDVHHGGVDADLLGDVDDVGAGARRLGDFADGLAVLHDGSGAVLLGVRHVDGEQGRFDADDAAGGGRLRDGEGLVGGVVARAGGDFGEGVGRRGDGGGGEGALEGVARFGGGGFAVLAGDGDGLVGGEVGGGGLGEDGGCQGEAVEGVHHGFGFGFLVL